MLAYLERKSPSSRYLEAEEARKVQPHRSREEEEDDPFDREGRLEKRRLGESRVILGSGRGGTSQKRSNQRREVAKRRERKRRLTSKSATKYWLMSFWIWVGVSIQQTSLRERESSPRSALDLAGSKRKRERTGLTR